MNTILEWKSKLARILAEHAYDKPLDEINECIAMSLYFDFNEEFESVLREILKRLEEDKQNMYNKIK